MKCCQLIHLQVIIIISVFCLVTCTTDPVLINGDELEEYYCNSYISTRDDKKTVFVGKTIPEHMPKDVSGARVAMSSDTHTVIFQEIRPGIYRDAQNELEIVAGKQYMLNVRFPDNHVMTGEIAVPGDFKNLTVSEHDTLEYIFDDTLFHQQKPGIEYYHAPKMQWTRSENAKWYDIDLYDQNSGKMIGFGFARDTAFVLPYVAPLYQFRFDSTIVLLDIESIIKIKACNSERILGGTGKFYSYHTITDSVVLRLKRRKTS